MDKKEYEIKKKNTFIIADLIFKGIIEIKKINNKNHVVIKSKLLSPKGRQL
jgi:hypothetical protein